MKTFFSLKDIFSPKLFSTLRSYNKEKFLQDALAGWIVAVVAIPLAIAFGISSGVGPTEGLVTAIIAGFIISALGLLVKTFGIDFVIACIQKTQAKQQPLDT